MDTPKSLIEHLEELRWRLIVVCGAFFIGVFIVYGFSKPILDALLARTGPLVFIAPQEALVSRLKIALYGGIMLASPIIMHQVWAFIALGLHAHERKTLIGCGAVSMVLFFTGALFGFRVIVPIGMEFLLAFATDLMQPMITVSNYISFVGTLTIAFGLVFELPLMIVLLTKFGIVTPELLCTKRRHAVIIIFIAAAFLTPPDVITQLMMALPLMILFELGIFFSKLVYQPKK